MRQGGSGGSDSLCAAIGRAALVYCLGLVVGCTDAGFQPIAAPDLETFDALLRVQGRFCTEPPEQVVFPVKVLFVTDQSSSLQCTDPDNRRFAAIGDIVSRLSANPYVSFGAIGFSSWSRELPFTRDRGAFDALIDPAGGLGPATDYQGALASAMRLLEADMIASEPGVRARTKYVIMFISDGVAEPRCLAGCEDDDAACTDDEDNDGDGLADAADPDCDDIDDNSIHPDNLYGVCNTTQEVPDDVYVDYDGICPSYNQPNQILFRVSELQRLADSYGVGELTLHTVLLFAPQEVVEARCPGASAQFGYNGGPARALLQSMAQRGGGTYRDVNLTNTAGGFLDFDFTALDSDQWLTQLAAFNRNARRIDGVVVPDSDADGLADSEELELGTDALDRNSDGDSYSDLFETRLAEAGFDPLDALLPAAPCSDGEDLDGDGLNGCEEDFLGTRVRGPDSDGDGLLDGLELVAGTDPTVADAEPDVDFDTTSNIDELLGGTDPLTPDAAVFRDQRIRYALTDLGNIEVTRDDRTEVRHCYDFSVSQIALTTPQAMLNSASTRGLNRIILQTMERPVLLSGVEARVHVACIDVLYNGPTEKVPESGLIDWTPEGWDRFRGEIDDLLYSIALCDPTEGKPSLAEYRRDNLNLLIDTCLPERVALGDILWKRPDLEELLRSLVHSDLTLRSSSDPSAMFVPIETFDPATMCFRPGAVADLEEFLTLVRDECALCVD